MPPRQDSRRVVLSCVEVPAYDTPPQCRRPCPSSVPARCQPRRFRGATRPGPRVRPWRYPIHGAGGGAARGGKRDGARSSRAGPGPRGREVAWGTVPGSFQAGRTPRAAAGRVAARRQTHPHGDVPPAIPGAMAQRDLMAAVANGVVRVDDWVRELPASHFQPCWCCLCRPPATTSDDTGRSTRGTGGRGRRVELARLSR
jgi:hypothetical protein